ncbi:MAG: hypothetical protein AAB215_03955 [Planctomycetota bacterium]
MKHRAFAAGFACAIALALPSDAGEKKWKGKRGPQKPPAAKTPEEPPAPALPAEPAPPPKPEKKDLIEASGLPGALAERFQKDFEKKVLHDEGRFAPEQRGALLTKAGEMAKPRFAAFLADAFEGIETDPLEKAVAFLKTGPGQEASRVLAGGCLLVLDRQSVWVNGVAHGQGEPPEAPAEARAFADVSGILDGAVRAMEKRLPPTIGEDGRARLRRLIGAHLAVKAAMVDPKSLAEATAFFGTPAGKALAGRLEQAAVLILEQGRRALDDLEREVLKAAGVGPAPAPAPAPSPPSATPPESPPRP